MTELNNFEIALINGGLSGLGPNLPPLTPKIVDPNVEAFLHWKLFHVIDPETFI